MSKTIYAALVAAQAEIGGVVAKNANNPYFGSSYADLAAVTAIAVPALAKQGIAVIVETELNNSMLTVRTILALSKEEQVFIDVPIPLGNGGAQAFGSAMTYGRRYGLSALCGIAQADDDGAEAEASAPSYPRQARQQAPAQPQQSQKPQQQAPEQEQAAGGVLEKVLKGVEGCETLERLDAATGFANAQLSGVELKVALKAIEQQRSKISA